MNLRQKILKRAIEKFSDIDENHSVSRYYPTSTEREAGAFLWGIGDVINGPHYREIVPETK